LQALGAAHAALVQDQYFLLSCMLSLQNSPALAQQALAKAIHTCPDQAALWDELSVFLQTHSATLGSQRCTGAEAGSLGPSVMAATAQASLAVFHGRPPLEVLQKGSASNVSSHALRAAAFLADNNTKVCLQQAIAGFRLFLIRYGGTTVGPAQCTKGCV
jgi:hypothetical protein